MRTASAILPCIFLGLLITGCAKKTTPTEATATASATATPSADLSRTGIEECDAYIKAANTCLEKLTGDDREKLRISIEQQQNQVKQATSDVAKDAASIGCETELDALKEDPTCN